MKKLKSKIKISSDWGYPIALVVILGVILSVMALVIDPTDKNEITLPVHDATVNAHIKTADGKTKMIYLVHRETNNYNHNIFNESMCVVDDFTPYKIGMKIDDYRCHYNKSLKGKQLLVVDQIGDALGE